MRGLCLNYCERSDALCELECGHDGDHKESRSDGWSVTWPHANAPAQQQSDAELGRMLRDALANYGTLPGTLVAGVRLTGVLEPFRLQLELTLANEKGNTE